MSEFRTPDKDIYRHGISSKALNRRRGMANSNLVFFRTVTGFRTTVHFLDSDGVYCMHAFEFKVVRPCVDIVLKDTVNLDSSAPMTGLSFFDSPLALRNSAGVLNASPYVRIPRGRVVNVPEGSLRWSDWQEQLRGFHIGLVPGIEQTVAEYLSACHKVIDTGEIRDQDTGPWEAEGNEDEDEDTFRPRSITDAPQATETLTTGASVSPRPGGRTTTDSLLGRAMADEYKQPGENREESSCDENCLVTETDPYLFKCLEESLELFSARSVNPGLQVCVSAICVAADRCQRRYSSMLKLLKEVGSVQDPSRLNAVLLCWEEDIQELSELIRMALDCKDREEFFQQLFLNRQHCWLFMWCLAQPTWDEHGDAECLELLDYFCVKYEHFELTRLMEQNSQDDLFARACIYFKSRPQDMPRIDEWVSEESKKMMNSFPSQMVQDPMFFPVLVELKIMLKTSTERRIQK